MINKPIARFITRGKNGYGGSGPVDLLLGVCFKNQEFFKACHVYEVREVFDGEICIKDLGPSALDAPKKSILDINWARDVSSILDCGDKYIYLTKTELREIIKKENNKKQT